MAHFMSIVDFNVENVTDSPLTYLFLVNLLLMSEN